MGTLATMTFLAFAFLFWSIQNKILTKMCIIATLLNMKHGYMILSVILLISAIFGFFFMHSGNAMGHEGCLAAQMQGAQCPGEAAGSVKFSLFHLKAFEIISTAVVKSFYVASFLVIIAFLLARLVLLYELFLFAWVKTRMRAYFMVCTQQYGKHFGYWISLHEHSPAFFMAAM